MSTFLKGFEFGEQFIPIKVDGQPKFYQRLGFRKVEIISQAEVMTDLAGRARISGIGPVRKS